MRVAETPEGVCGQHGNKGELVEDLGKTEQTTEEVTVARKIRFLLVWLCFLERDQMRERVFAFPFEVLALIIIAKHSQHSLKWIQ